MQLSHRAGRLTAVVALTVTGLVSGTVVGASADSSTDTSVPSQAQVDAARQAAAGAQSDVASLQGQLAAAGQRLDAAAIAAGKAAEAYDAARWHLKQARATQRRTTAEAQAAAAVLATQKRLFGDLIVSSYESSPEMTALSGILQSDGISEVIDRTVTMENARNGMAQQETNFRNASTRAQVTQAAAETATTAATTLAQQTAQARVAAEAAQNSAAAAFSTISAERRSLLRRLATLQGISVQLAAQRQWALDHPPAPVVPVTPTATATPTQAAPPPHSSAPAPAAPTPPAPAPSDPTPTKPADPAPSNPPPAPTPSDPPANPSPTPTDPPSDPAPAPASGAQAAIAFARAQLGKPYRWGATGPGSYDCSGLTMRSWQAGGIYLPHYAAGQYSASAPISASALQPGDLLFWGDSNKPSSIYHVALYIGNGQMIHAPRTGENVRVDSMYYWIAPNFFARP